jgi:hypothetical protein
MVAHLLDYGSALAAKSGKVNPRSSRMVGHLASRGSHAVSCLTLGNNINFSAEKGEQNVFNH